MFKPKRCPTCSAELEEIDREQIFGVWHRRWICSAWPEDHNMVVEKDE